MNKAIKLNVYGKLVLALKSDHGWEIFYQGNDGKRRLADDLFVPSFISEEEIEGYLSDLCHEWATDKRISIKLDNKITSGKNCK